jgi:hypothetical protein
MAARHLQGSGPRNIYHHEEDLAVLSSGHVKYGRVVLCTAVAILFTSLGLAHEPAAKSDHRVVLRVSESMLNSMMDSKDVERAADVQEVILGTTVYGRAHTTGKPTINLIESPDRAVFEIKLNGVTVSQNTGYNGPAIIYSRSVTNFTATKLVAFEPGKGFYGAPAKVAARTQTTIQGIDSSRGGIIGRIVRRRAANIEAAQHAQVEQIASQRAQLRIQQAFEKRSNARLAKLNEVADVRSLAAATGHSTAIADTKYVCCTTKNYFQIATGFSDTDSGGPIKLPEQDPANSKNAPIEVWVHQSLVGEQIASGIDMLTQQVETSPLGLTVSSAARYLTNSESSDMIPAIIGKQPLHVCKVGEWRVAKLEMPPQDLAQVVQVLRPTLDNNKLAASRPKSHAKEATNGATRLANGLRTWTSGKYTAHARFLSLDGDTVRLQRSTGVNTQIAFEKLSPTDQQWIRQYVANAPKTAAK